mgnify:CR=1 FL=1
MENEKNITVLGIGRLGLCFALTLERGGYNVVGYDIRKDYVCSIENKTLKSYEPGVEQYLLEAENFRPTTDLEEAINHANILFILVRTTSLPDGKYDTSQVEKLLEAIEKHGRVKSKHLVISCNVNPGYSDAVQKRMKKFGYIVSYNPEWVAQGRILKDQAYPDLVVIGQANKEAGDVIEQIYKNICKSNPKIHRMDRLSAEITKVSLNCFLSTKLSYANMIGEIALKSGVSPDPILAAIGDDSRINPKYFKYGFGYGGPCLPRDTRAMVNYANKIGINPSIIKAVMEVNKSHLAFQIEQFVKKHDKNKPVVIDSVTYKPGTVIIEESQQLLFAVEIAKRGYKVIIREHPEVIRQVKALYGNLFVYEEREYKEYN